MAVVVYKCTVCNRTLERNFDPEVPDVVGRCIITDNCKGVLYRIDFKPRVARVRLPSPVPGLTDWLPRQALYTHEQTVETTTWLIQHNLNNKPIVVVYIYKFDYRLNKDVLVEAVESEYNVEYVDEHNVSIEFQQPRKGIAQFIVKDTSIERKQVTPKTKSVQYVIGPKGTLTFAFASRLVNGLTHVPFEINLYNSTNGQLYNTITKDIQLHNYLPNYKSPWSLYNTVIVGGQRYIIGSVSIDEEIKEGSGTYINLPTLTFGTNDVLMLYARPPFSVADLDLSNVLYLKTLQIGLIPPFDMVYNGQDFEVVDTFFTKIYPPLIVL